MTDFDNHRAADKVSDVIQRLTAPRTEADRELLWVAIIAFIAGALIF